MKIAIISDSHDNVPNIEKFLYWAKENRIEMIIHCGDIAAPSVISKLIVPSFSGPVHLVYGNVADRELLAEVCKKFSNVTLHGDQGEIEIDGKKMAFCHKPDLAQSLASRGECQIVFYGHTHKPWIESVGSCQLVNPGTLGGLFQKATFAVYDSKTTNLELKLLEDL